MIFTLGNASLWHLWILFQYQTWRKDIKEPHLKTSVLDVFEITKNFVLFLARFDNKIISELPSWYMLAPPVKPQFSMHVHALHRPHDQSMFNSLKQF